MCCDVPFNKPIIVHLLLTNGILVRNPSRGKINKSYVSYKIGKEGNKKQKELVPQNHRIIVIVSERKPFNRLVKELIPLLEGELSNYEKRHEGNELNSKV